jgi:predicted nuclease of predicted toxin-antitoxin system
MRIKLDENIPARAAAHLRALGHDADTVLEEGLGGREDAAIWAAAKKGGRFSVTQEMDFSGVQRFVPNGDFYQNRLRHSPRKAGFARFPLRMNR